MAIVKEQYFSPSSIDVTAQKLLESAEKSTRKRPIISTMEQSALLVLDMQEYFLSDQSHAFVPSATAILPKVNALIKVCTPSGLPVILTRHINTPQNAGLMAVWWKDILSADMNLSRIAPRIDQQEAIVISKTRYDAFIYSPLEAILKKRKIRQVVICGVMTHLCCETTARSAFMRGYEVFFTVDGTATYNEAFHSAALLNLAHGFATPVLADTIISIVERKSG
ncbi:MAG: cysteine hydrolase [Proteobacteria bacterium]|jgi:isochorismate hydrolase|nr:cysteine hydrolase [Pseudomonadota bacterium]